MKIVVSRYNEDVVWANGVNNCIIYNKGSDIPNTRHPVTPLKNVGREAETYLYYIITNYDNLEDYTLFLQGYPFDHSPTLEKYIKEFEQKIANNQKIPFTFITKDIYNCTLTTDFTDINLPLLMYYHKLFDKYDSSHPFSFGAGAQFLVPKECILSRSKKFYEKCIKMLDYDANPIEAYIFERFWHMIFTKSD